MRAAQCQCDFAPLGPTISLNCSARQIADPHFVSDARAVLATTKLAPGSLTLEITESVLIGDPDAAAARLRDIKSTGVRLAIDDFGTGYSSLSSLQSLPVDMLKIDKAFIDRVTNSPEAAGLVKAIRRLARTFQLATVAEGVEQAARLERLQNRGCDQIQGFVVAPPMPAREIAGCLTARTASVFAAG